MAIKQFKNGDLVVIDSPSYPEVRVWRMHSEGAMPAVLVAKHNDIGVVIDDHDRFNDDQEFVQILFSYGTGWIGIQSIKKVSYARRSRIGVE